LRVLPFLFPVVSGIKPVYGRELLKIANKERARDPKQQVADFALLDVIVIL